MASGSEISSHINTVQSFPNFYRYGGDYDIFKDPNKHSVAHSIGERRPLLGMKQVLPIGPGYYNDGKAFSFGERCPISSSAVDARKGRSR